MRRLLIMIVALLVVAAIGATFAVAPPGQVGLPAFAQEEAPANTITVSGTGISMVAPDLLVVTLGVETQADTAQAAQQQNAETMNAVLEALRAQGLTDEDIQTSQLSLQPVREEPTPERPTPGNITGYRAVNTVTVRLQQIGQAGEVIDAAVQAGANVVGNIFFSVQDTSAPQQDALRAALDDARTKADTIATDIGVTITGIRSVSELGIAVPFPLAGQEAIGRGGAEVAPIEPGQLTVTANVRVTFNY